MKTKVRLFMLVILISLLGVLAGISLYADGKRVPDVLFITPKQPINTAIDDQKIEDKNGEDFLLTYETNNAGSIKALNNNYEVILKGTNYLYPYIMRNRIVAGSFFSKEAQKENKKLAVLNKKAAFDIFGNLDITNAEIKIDGEVFTVIGVIDDSNKKNRNVYIPVYYSEKSIDSFAALINSQEKTPEAALENKLKQFNIDNNRYNFCNLNSFTDNMSLRFSLSLKLFLLVILIYALIQCFKTVIGKLSRLKKQSEQLDFDDLMINNKATVVSIAFFTLSSVGLSFSVLATALSSVNHILNLRDIKNIMMTDYSSGFSNIIYIFNKLSIYSQGAFAACIALIVLFTVLLLITEINPRATR